MKYIIEIEPIYGTDLYKAKGANTLVFDQKGIEQILTPYEPKKLKRWETIKSDDDVRRILQDAYIEIVTHNAGGGAGLVLDKNGNRMNWYEGSDYHFKRSVVDYLLEEIDAD